MLKSILIDDEINSLESLEYELRRHCPEVTIIGTYKNPFEGAKAVREEKPDVLFIDIEMPGMSGFDVVRQIKDQDVDIVFVTAYDEYAIRAFRVSAVDYLLKPVDVDELKLAIQRVSAKRHPAERIKRLENLMQYFEGLSSPFQKIAIPSLKGFDLVDVRDILYCLGEGNYTTIVTVRGEKYITSRTLKETEELLNNSVFFRAHQSYLVNLHEVKQYIRGSGGELIMNDGSRIQVARARKEALLQILKKGY